MTLSKLRSSLRLVPVLLALGALGGCAGVAVGAAATVGTAAYDERGIKGVAKDSAIATQIRAKYFDTEVDLLKDVGLEVYEGRVMLTGVVTTDEMRADAVRLAWSVDGVNDVINELNIEADGVLDNIGNDTWITTKLKTNLTRDENIYSINYGVETVAGVVYLIGIAQDQDELTRVIAHARDIERVRRVVSHVRVKAAGE